MQYLSAQILVILEYTNSKNMSKFRCNQETGEGGRGIYTRALFPPGEKLYTILILGGNNMYAGALFSPTGKKIYTGPFFSMGKTMRGKVYATTPGNNFQVYTIQQLDDLESKTKQEADGPYRSPE